MVDNKGEPNAQPLPSSMKGKNLTRETLRFGKKGIEAEKSNVFKNTTKLSPDENSDRKELPTRRTEVMETDIGLSDLWSAPDHIKTRRFHAGIRTDNDFFFHFTFVPHNTGE
ncbi:hypothetical protein CEXT_730781 [Caerostris extrusa]|uniref:Uncharacterized protein n=1 Tax=Caerostris extrusa TaxID=172846 RepID=A0AAV4UK82_CAEEX|nr:hypothetical protein CEXT_730781 [Caerostris extrusa]